MQRDKTVQLHALLDKEYYEQREAVIVKEIKLDTGSSIQSYAFSYEEKGIRMEGFSPLFQKVRVFPVSANAPYGYTDYTYFNGLPDTDPAACYPPDDDYSNARAYYSRFAGQLYKTEVFRADGGEDRADITYRKALDKQAYMLRPLKMVEQVYFPVYDLETGKAGEYKVRESVICNSYETDYYQLRETVKTGWDQKGEALQLITRFGYTWEYYPSLKKAHLLDKQIFSVKYKNNTNEYLEAEAIIWEETEKGRWKETKSYSWSGEGIPAYPSDGKRQGWNLEKENTAWNQKGLVTEFRNINENYENTCYSKDGMVETAHFTNASSGQAVFCSFEDYEDLSGWICGSDIREKTESSLEELLETDDCYSGSRSLGLRKNNTVRVRLLPNPSGQYLFRAAVKYEDTAANEGEEQKAGRLTLKLTGKGKTKEQVFDISASKYWTVFSRQFSLQEDGAEALEVSISGPEKGRLLLDAVFVTPLQSEAIAMVYAGDMKLTCARYTNRESGNLFWYDSCLKQAVTTREDGNAVSITRQLLTRKGDNSNKKVSLSVQFPYGGKIWPFYRRNDFGQEWEADSSWKYRDGALISAEKGSSVLRYKGETKEQYAFYFTSAGKYEADGNTDGSFCMQSGDVKIHWNLEKGSVEENGKILADFSMDRQTLRADFLFLRIGDRIALYSGEEVLFLCRVKEKEPAGFSFAMEGEMAVSCMGLAKRPRLTVSYTDDTGIACQDQTVTDDGVMVSHALYSPMMQQSVRTKAGKIKDSLWEYQAEFVTGFDEKSGEIKGNINGIFPEDEGYPYERSITTKSPVPYLIQCNRPGKDFALSESGKDRSVKYHKYIPQSLPEGSSVQGAWMDCCQEPDGKKTFLVYDSFDYRILQIVQSPEGEKQITRYENDAFGRLCKVFLPKSFGSSKEAGQFTEEIYYDRAGNTTGSKSPDIGESRFLYDWRGRLYYEQHQDGIKEGWYLYHLYDSYGRETENGCCTGQWDEEKLRKRAIGGGTRPENAEWSVRYFYDGTDQALYQTGRLCRAETRGASGIVTETFSYNDSGNMIRYSQCTEGQEHILEVDYNQAGEMLSQCVDGDEKNRVFYNYTLDGNLKEIGISGQVICQNAYHASGLLQKEVFAPQSQNPLERIYEYNSANWLTLLKDRYMSQDISYDMDSGRIVSMQMKIDGASEGFPGTLDTSCTYDGFGRLKSVSYKQLAQYNMGTQRPFSYDENSNILAADINECCYTKGTNRVASFRNISYEYTQKGACAKRQHGEDLFSKSEVWIPRRKGAG